MKKIKICELVEDFEVYPRIHVDDQHVAYMAESIRAGNEMPAIVIDKASKRIVDGFHRKRAWQKVYGPDHEIEVIEKKYTNDGELFLDAARYNSIHGRRMATADYARVIARASVFGLDDVMVAAVLHITTDKLTEIKTTRLGRITARVSHHDGQEDGKDFLPDGQIPLKRTIQKMAGKTLSRKQAEANTKLSGMKQVFYANQIILLLENDLIDLDDDKLFDRLRILYDLLGPTIELRTVAEPVD